MEAIDLSEMLYAFRARYVEEKGCLLGMCKSLLAEICNILNNPNGGALWVSLLTRVTESGKSAVAYLITWLYDRQKWLGLHCIASSNVAS